MRRIASVLVAVLLQGGFPMAASAASSSVSAPTCRPRLLVLSAFPAEMGRILSVANLEPRQPVRSADRRVFYVGTFEGSPVIMALTGIGPVNARTTTKAAFATFGRACIRGVVFSGVAGAGTGSRIGDVTVPDRWTQDGGKTWAAADPRMRATAEAVAPSVRLEQSAPLGDPACACSGLGLVPIVKFPYLPRVMFHGNGSTTDPFGGRAAPCLPHGGDLAGCEPCPAALHSPPDAQRFVSGMARILDPGFVLALIAPAPAPSHKYAYVAFDEETAAAALVAARYGTPFIGFRAISDGTADPLMLPGFPAQFFVYKQFAADNAAAVALAFIKAWR